MTTILILQLLQIAGFVVGGAILKHALSGYLAEKGKNLATKEDIAEITRRIEETKLEYAQILEKFRVDLTSGLHRNQFRYQKEFEILAELATVTVELRDSARSLRPPVDFSNQTETEEARKERRLKLFYEKRDCFLKMIETRRPFYPDELYRAAGELNITAFGEAFEYARRDSIDLQYWDKAIDNSEKIATLGARVLDLIRKRVKEWDET